jgi:hypothetical protein
MARVRFSGRATRRGALPMVCMVCGDDADVRLRKRFSWHPPWVIVLIFTGLLPYVLVAFLLTKSKAVDVPMCSRHQHYWLFKFLIVAGLFVVTLFAAFGLLALAVANDLGGWVCFTIIFFFVAWLVATFLVQQFALRPVEITDDSITLGNVHEDFVEEWEAMRGERTGRRYDDEEDDEDDYRPRPRR